MVWTAWPRISRGEAGDGWILVECRTTGDSREEALAAAELILHSMADGKIAVIRCEPKASSETDFDTKQVLHRGFVRFAYRDEPGEWQYTNRDYESGIDMSAFGLPPQTEAVA